MIVHCIVTVANTTGIILWFFSVLGGHVMVNVFSTLLNYCVPLALSTSNTRRVKYRPCWIKCMKHKTTFLMCFHSLSVFGTLQWINWPFSFLLGLTWQGCSSPFSSVTLDRFGCWSSPRRQTQLFFLWPTFVHYSGAFFLFLYNRNTPICCLYGNRNTPLIVCDTYNGLARLKQYVLSYLSVYLFMYTQNAMTTGVKSLACVSVFCQKTWFWFWF